MSNVDTLDKVVSKIEAALVKLGPEISEHALHAASLIALENLITAFVCLIGSFVFGYVGMKLLNTKSDRGKYDLESADVIIKRFMGGFACFFALISFTASIESLVRPANWVGVTNPKTFIAYQILRKVK